MRTLTATAAGLWIGVVSVFAPAQQTTTAALDHAAEFTPLAYPIDADAFDRNLSQDERDVFQLIEKLVAIRLKRTLEADDKTMMALGEKSGALSKQLTMLKWQRAGLREHMRWCLQFGASEIGVKNTLDMLLSDEEHIAETLEQMVRASQPVVGVARSAELYLFVDDFERFLATRVKEAMKSGSHMPDAAQVAAPDAHESDHAVEDGFHAFQQMLKQQNKDVALSDAAGEDVVKLVDALLVVRLAQALDINKEETVRLFAHVGQVKDQLHELKWQIGHDRSILRDTIAAKAPDAQIQKQLDDLLIEEKAVAKLVRDFVEGAGKDVTVAQSARLYLFLGDFEAYIVGLLEHTED